MPKRTTISRAERERYQLEHNLIASDSRELLEAVPTDVDRSGQVQGYRIPRTNGTVTFMGRMACHKYLMKLKGVEPGGQIVNGVYRNTLTAIPGHQGAPANCCKHVIEQDPVHPEGIILFPFGLFVCKTCFKLKERCRFKRRDIVVICRDCVETVARELRDKNPELFIDQREIKT